MAPNDRPAVSSNVSRVSRSSSGAAVRKDSVMTAAYKDQRRKERSSDLPCNRRTIDAHASRRL
jgi:hypothetical protein